MACDVGPHALDVGAGLELDQHVGDVVGRHVDQGSRAVERREDVRRHGERADALGQARDAHARGADLGGVADALDAKLRQIGLVDDHGIARAQSGNVALDHIPRGQAAVLGIGADHHHERRAAGRLAPVGEGGDERDGLGDARRRQSATYRSRARIGWASSKFLVP